MSFKRARTKTHSDHACTATQDKYAFAPSNLIYDLFDPYPMRYVPGVANDLSSFSQLYMYAYFLRRLQDPRGLPIGMPEYLLFHRLLEKDPFLVRDFRRSQCGDVRKILAYYEERKAATPHADRWKEPISIAKALCNVLQVNFGQEQMNRFPAIYTPYEGDAQKAKGEYSMYVGAFQLLGEDFDEGMARMKAEADQWFEEYLRTKEMGDTSTEAQSEAIIG